MVIATTLQPTHHTNASFLPTPEIEDLFNTSIINGTTSVHNSRPLSPIWSIGLGIVMPIICMFGIIGNALSLIVLRDKSFGAVMFIYVRWMAFSDLVGMIVIMFEGLNKVRDTLHYYSYMEAVYFAHLSTPIANAMLGCSSLFVVLMTIERYLSVCHPLRAKILSTPVRARLFVILVYLVCFAIYAVSVNDYVVVLKEHVDDESGPIKEVFLIDQNIKFIRNVWYSEVYTWARAILVRFTPFIIIFILNIFTVRSYRQILVKRRKILQRVPTSGAGGGMAKRYQDENNIIIILICTAVVYVVCLSPMPVAYLLMQLHKDLINNSAFIVYLVIGNNLEILNSALNFYLYCLACREFRRCLQNLLITCGSGAMVRCERFRSLRHQHGEATERPRRDTRREGSDETEMVPLSAHPGGDQNGDAKLLQEQQLGYCRSSS